MDINSFNKILVIPTLYAFTLNLHGLFYYLFTDFSGYGPFLILWFLYLLGKTLTGIILWIINCIMFLDVKKKKPKNNQQNNQQNNKQNNSEEVDVVNVTRDSIDSQHKGETFIKIKYILFHIFYMILLSLLDACTYVCYFLPIYILKKGSESERTALTVVEILSKEAMSLITILFCAIQKFIFLYRHHYIAIVLIVVGLIFSNSWIYFGENSAAFQSISKKISTTVGISFGLISSIKETSEKKFLQLKNVNPHLTMIYQGVIQLIGICLIGWFVAVKNQQLSLYFILLLWEQSSTVIILSFVSGLIMNVTGLETSNQFGPTLKSIADALFLIQYFVIWDQSEQHNILLYCGLLPFLLGVMIFNDIIILPFSNLDLYTDNSIAIRAQKNEMEELNNQNLSMTIIPQDLNNTSLNSAINS